MNNCEWCDRSSNDLVQYTDGFGTYHICNDCLTKATKGECRKCNEPEDPTMLVYGLCHNCIQVEMAKRSKLKEEARMGLILPKEMASGAELSEEDFQAWMLSSKAFSPKDLKKPEMKFIWILVKFRVIGIYDAEIVKKYFKDASELLDRNMSILIGNKSRFVLANTAEGRKDLRGREIIDYSGDLYIIRD